MVYRWVDENNVVHFSQHQPIGDDYTEFLVSNQSKITSRADTVKDSTKNDRNKSSNQKDITTPLDEKMSKNCKDATENLALLETFENVQYTDENGKNQILNEKEKQLQLEINQKRKEVYCSPSS